MVKVKQPIKEFWESEKKPEYLKIAKRKTKENFDNIVKFIMEKPTRKKK